MTRLATTALAAVITLVGSAGSIEAQQLRMHQALYENLKHQSASSNWTQQLARHANIEVSHVQAVAHELMAYYSLDARSRMAYLRTLGDKLVEQGTMTRAEVRGLIQWQRAMHDNDLRGAQQALARWVSIGNGSELGNRIRQDMSREASEAGYDSPQSVFQDLPPEWIGPDEIPGGLGGPMAIPGAEDPRPGWVFDLEIPVGWTSGGPPAPGADDTGGGGSGGGGSSGRDVYVNGWSTWMGILGGAMGTQPAIIPGVGPIIAGGTAPAGWEIGKAFGKAVGETHLSIWDKIVALVTPAETIVPGTVVDPCVFNPDNCVPGIGR